MKKSDFYWGVAVLSTLILINIHYTTERIFFLIAALLFFIISLFLSHNKKLRKNLDEVDNE